MALSDICGISNVLGSDYLAAITSINRKFNALRRFSELLEQLGNVSALIPDISNLIPIGAITSPNYQALVSACPFLNLPKIPSDIDLSNLRNLVSSAYKSIIQTLTNHPFSRLGNLQGQLDKFQSKLSGALGGGAQFLQCFQQACSGDGISFVNNFSSTSAQAQISQFNQNFVATGGQILTPEMQRKVTAIKDSISRVNQLITGVITTPGTPVQIVPEIPIPGEHPVPPPPTGPVP